MGSQVQCRRKEADTVESNIQGSMSTKQIIFTLVLVLSITTGGYGETTCSLASLRSDGLPSSIPISLDQLKFAIKPETSRVDVRITNHDARPINAIFMVVDFQVRERYQLSTIFHLATSAQEDSFIPAAHASPAFFGISPLSSSLLPGASYNDWAESTQRALECPDEGRIAVLQIAFASGEPIDYRLPAWRVDPSLLKIDSWSQDGFPAKPVSVSGTLSVNERGRVRVVAMGVAEPQMSDAAESKLTSWLTDEIEGTFEFVPAQYNGASISCELEVLIRFYPIKEIDATINNLPTGWAKSPLTIIDLVSTVPGKGYELTYAGYPVSSNAVRRPKPR
jgi:hypothetical protein